MDNLKYWNKKRILITGGSSGLGRSIALQLCQLGAKVAIVARGEDRLSEVQLKCEGIASITADLSRKSDIYKIATQAESLIGEVDVLINSASYLGVSPLRELMDTDCEDFEKVLQTNLVGPFRLIKVIAASMRLRGAGLVVNISSDAAVNAYATWGSYSVSKAATDHLLKIFDTELSSEGVRFLTLDPGDMNTPMHFQAVPDADANELKSPEQSARELIGYVGNQEYLQVRNRL